MDRQYALFFLSALIALIAFSDGIFALSHKNIVAVNNLGRSQAATTILANAQGIPTYNIAPTSALEDTDPTLNQIPAGQYPTLSTCELKPFTRYSGTDDLAAEGQVPCPNNSTSPTTIGVFSIQTSSGAGATYVAQDAAATSNATYALGTPSVSLAAGAPVSVSPGSSVTVQWDCMPSLMDDFEAVWGSKTHGYVFFNYYADGFSGSGPGWSVSSQLVYGSSVVTLPSTPGNYNFTFTCSLSNPTKIANNAGLICPTNASGGCFYRSPSIPNSFSAIIPIVDGVPSSSYNLTGPSSVALGTAPTLSYTVPTTATSFYVQSSTGNSDGMWTYGPGTNPAYPSTGTITGDTQTGTETYEIYAYQTDGTSALKPPTVTVATNASCTPNWQCSGFGSCVSGMQTQTCSDLNSCGTSIGEPALSQSCAACPANCPGSGAPNCIANNGYTYNSSNNTCSLVGSSVTATPSSNYPGGPELVAVSNGPGNPSDYVLQCSSSLTPSQCSASPINKLYVGSNSVTPPATGISNATLNFTLSATPGSYYFELFSGLGQGGGSTPTATSNTVTASSILSSFTANPSRIDKTTSTTLSWSGSALTGCSITASPSGPAISYISNTATGGSATAGPINAKTSFILSCSNTTPLNVTVTIVPTVIEI